MSQPKLQWSRFARSMVGVFWKAYPGDGPTLMITPGSVLVGDTSFSRSEHSLNDVADAMVFAERKCLEEAYRLYGELLDPMKVP